MRPLHIGFVTDEFVTETPDCGGLATYLDRISRTLRDQGHRVDVITRTFGEPQVIDRDGVRVQSVRPTDHGLSGVARRLAQLRWGAIPPLTRGRLKTALALARATAERAGQRPFDFVQSTNCSLAGLLVNGRGVYRHVVRMSSARELWLTAEGIRPDRDERLTAWLERLCMQRAHAVYAPSRFLAEHFERRHGLAVQVLRPPLFVEGEKDREPEIRLPERYLLHFGNLTRRKGSDWLAQALLRAWEREPHLTMVWVGREMPPGRLERYREMWGPQSERVVAPGALPRAEVVRVLARATASVLPSLADNLPNTVAESLALSVPVLGSRGASIDELVEHGRSGELVPLGDVEALADALVRVWRGEPRWLGDGFQRPEILEAMLPERAAEALVRLALDVSL